MIDKCFQVTLTAILALMISASASASALFEPPEGWKPVLAEHEFFAGNLPGSVILAMQSTVPGQLWRRGRALLHSTEFPDMHRADSLATLEHALRGREFATDGHVSLIPESRCSGRAWWARWEDPVRVGGVLEQRELIFENSGWIGLIDYMYPAGTRPDRSVLSAMIAYCSTFSETLKLHK